MTEIENQSEFYFLYNSELIDVTRKVDISVKKEKVNDILSRLFSDNEVDVSISDRHIVLTPVAEMRGQQQNSVSGKVTDADGLPLPGVTVLVKGTTNGTVTNSDGNYTLSNISENTTLQFSFVGMKGQEVVVAGKTTIDITLAEDAIGIEEVVAIGYGTARKKDLTGALTRINADDKSTLPNINAVQTMRGSVAGLRVTDNGKAGSDGAIIIRGHTSITANNEPLIVLDGIPMVGGKLSDISSNDIESFDILKDASSAG